MNLAFNNLSTPTNLILSNIANYIELNWEGNGEEYIIYRNNDSLVTTTLRTYKDSIVVNGTNYCYTIKGKNTLCESEYSDEECLTFVSLIEVLANRVEVSLYPIPARDKVKIITEGLFEDSEVILYDINGKIHKKYYLKANQRELEIDICDLVKGAYSIRIINDKTIISRKLIVN